MHMQFTSTVAYSDLAEVCLFSRLSVSSSVFHVHTVADSRVADSRVADSGGADSRVADCRGAESRVADCRGAESREQAQFELMFKLLLRTIHTDFRVFYSKIFPGFNFRFRLLNRTTASMMRPDIIPVC